MHQEATELHHVALIPLIALALALALALAFALAS